MTRGRLVLEDGTVYEGEAFGTTDDAIGEVVFNTSIGGYQEIMTDPSYRFQIIVMTSPHIGNYGIEASVAQSGQPQIAGLIVREISEYPSNHLSEISLPAWLTENGVAALSGIDTRSLTRRIRAQGAMRGMITTRNERTIEELVAELKLAPSMSGLDLVKEVTSVSSFTVPADVAGPDRRRIALYDFGAKRDIVRHLTRNGCDVTVFPATTPADDLLALAFDGVVLSNGPGDPEPVTYARDNIRRLIGRLPILGICLGHQLLGLALGGRTYKLKFGHRGGNHPVKDLRTGSVEITAQNHGFSVDADSLPESEIELTHVNLNDGTLEGFRHRTHPILAVQYHPEAAPGPHDSFHLFDDFVDMMKPH
ncbi:MAG TPA: glutamine-hydrolyzing carbamoyl-phosphate synthase small subunit [Thermoanaerobaculia bacterium]|nr:glutamine-hydrolyzing carbamoyl-phosphate synthase small subunit [Thermoanaerobaculia bacterium]